ncbi:hypothetical protein [Mesorhizobium sp. A556]
MSDTMSQAEFSRLHSVSRKTVTSWKSKGLLVIDEAGKVVVAASNKMLADNCLGVTPVLPEVTESASEDSSPELTDAEFAALEVYAKGNAPLVFVEAKRVKENYLALLRQLEYETKAGRLVDKEALSALHAKRWSGERQALEDWPSRITPQLAAKFGIDPVELRVALEEEMNKHLIARAERPSSDPSEQHLLGERPVTSRKDSRKEKARVPMRGPFYFIGNGGSGSSRTRASFRRRFFFSLRSVA